MEKITNKEIRILRLINDFTYLDIDFFINILYPNSKRERRFLTYGVKMKLKKLLDFNYIEIERSHDQIEFYKTTEKGRVFLMFRSITVFKSNLKINGAKFHHHRLSSLIYSKIVPSYKIAYMSERTLLSMSNDGIVPDLAIKYKNTIVYFEIELSQKQEKIIKEKLSKYEKKSSNVYIVYLTESNAVIKAVNQLKKKYLYSHRFKAYSLYDFMKNPTNYLREIEGFSETIQWVQPLKNS